MQQTVSDWRFVVDERPDRRLLVASVSEVTARHPFFSKRLRVPSPGKNLLNRLQKQSNTSKHGQLPFPTLLGSEAQRLAALIGGLVISGLAQTTQRISTIRHPGYKKRPAAPFRLPWSNLSKRLENRGAHDLARELCTRGCEYEKGLDVRAAVQCFEEASKLVPCEIAYLCLAAKQWTDLTFYHDVHTDRERRLVNMKAIEYANKALELDSKCAHCHVVSCVSKGRLALFADNKAKVQLAKEAQDAAALALALDPSLDLAHHLMGRWHYEMSRVNGLVRTLVRFMYGTALPTGTRENALGCYRKAIELAPSRLIHKVEAGRILLELGQRDEAVVLLEDAINGTVNDINDWHTRMDGEMLLAQAHKKPWRQPSPIPPPCPPVHA